jgi:hypothetical protein
MTCMCKYVLNFVDKFSCLEKIIDFFSKNIFASINTKL